MIQNVGHRFDVLAVFFAQIGRYGITEIVQDFVQALWTKAKTTSTLDITKNGRAAKRFVELPAAVAIAKRNIVGEASLTRILSGVQTDSSVAGQSSGCPRSGSVTFLQRGNALV